MALLPVPDSYLQLETNPPIYAPYFQAIGRAITRWQHVEVALGGLFVKVSTCRIEKVASAIFYNFHDFSDKIDMVHCAARLSLADTPEFEEWAGKSTKRGKGEPGLKRKLADAMELRNAVAHFHLFLQIPGPGTRVPIAVLQMSDKGDVIVGDHLTTIEPYPSGVHLLFQPNPRDPNQAFHSTPKWTKRPMKVKDIVKAGNRFIALRQDIETFSKKIQLHIQQ